MVQNVLNFFLINLYINISKNFNRLNTESDIIIHNDIFFRYKRNKNLYNLVMNIYENITKLIAL